MCTAFAILWDTKCNLMKGLISWFGTFPDNYWLANFFLISFNLNIFLISSRRYTFHLCFNDNWLFFTLHGRLHLSATSYYQILYESWFLFDEPLKGLLRLCFAYHYLMKEALIYCFNETFYSKLLISIEKSIEFCL